MGKKTPKITPSPWDLITPPEEDRATAISNMHKQCGTVGLKIACMWFGRYPRRQTDTHTHTDVLITILVTTRRQQSQDCKVTSRPIWYQASVTEYTPNIYISN